MRANRYARILPTLKLRHTVTFIVRSKTDSRKRQPAPPKVEARRFFEPELEYEYCAVTMKTSIAIYPGSFDPVTNGHLDLIERGEKMFDLLIVAVLLNAEKAPLFSVPERVDMLRDVTRQWSAVEIDVFDGLLVDYARKRSAGVILRGIRAISDYEYELQMALMNRKLEPRLETVFMLPGETYSYLSARLVREIARLGGPLTGLVPAIVEERLRAKVS